MLMIFQINNISFPDNTHIRTSVIVNCFGNVFFQVPPHIKCPERVFMPQMLSEMLSFFTEILETQGPSQQQVTTEVHAIPEDIDLEVKLEQEEEEGKEDEGCEVEVVSAASALLLLSQPKKEILQEPNRSLWEGNWQTPFNTCMLSVVRSVGNLPKLKMCHVLSAVSCPFQCCLAIANHL